MHACSHNTYMTCVHKQSKINSKIQKLEFFLCGNYLVISTCIVLCLAQIQTLLLHGYSCSKLFLYFEYSETPYIHHLYVYQIVIYSFI